MRSMLRSDPAGFDSIHGARGRIVVGLYERTAEAASVDLEGTE